MLKFKMVFEGNVTRKSDIENWTEAEETAKPKYSRDSVEQMSKYYFYTSWTILS